MKKAFFFIFVVTVGVYFFQTDLGWTYFYSFGDYEPDVRQVLRTEGVQPTQLKARLFWGSRAGYAHFFCQPDALGKMVDRWKTEGGFTQHPFEPEDFKELAEFSSKEEMVKLCRPPGEFPPETSDKLARAVFEGDMQAIQGGAHRSGPLAHFYIVYSLERGEAYLICAYPYG